MKFCGSELFNTSSLMIMDDELAVLHPFEHYVSCIRTIMKECDREGSVRRSIILVNPNL